MRNLGRRVGAIFIMTLFEPLGPKTPQNAQLSLNLTQTWPQRGSTWPSKNFKKVEKLFKNFLQIF